MMGFPENLGELRRRRGLTQAALAKRLGVLANQVSLYESGRSEPSLGVLRKLAVALSVSSDELLFGGEDPLDKDVALKRAFEATLLLQPEEQAVVKSLLDTYVAAHRSGAGGEGPRARKKRPT
jgi:transcriptional regulator with XRE-family HTH domain